MLKNENINSFLLIVILILSLLYLRQCGKSSNLEELVSIANNNTSAMSDSLTHYTSKSNNLVFQKGILISDKKELKKIYKFF